MEEFYTTLLPIAQMIADNWWYLVIMFGMIHVRGCSHMGILMAIYTMIFGFQNWILTTFIILGIMEHIGECYKMKIQLKNQDNNSK